MCKCANCIQFFFKGVKNRVFLIVFISIFIYNILIINILHCILLPITYPLPLTLKNKNVRNLHICTFSGKEAAAHHRNVP